MRLSVILGRKAEFLSKLLAVFPVNFLIFILFCDSFCFALIVKCLETKANRDLKIILRGSNGIAVILG